MLVIIIQINYLVVNKLTFYERNKPKWRESPLLLSTDEDS
jgi:hypothetical protein